MTSDATRCDHCGGPFAAERVHIGGKQFHGACSLASWPSHTNADRQRNAERIEDLEAAIRQAIRRFEALARADDREVSGFRPSGAANDLHNLWK